MQYTRVFVVLACAGLLVAAGPADEKVDKAVSQIQAGDFHGAASILKPLLAQTPGRSDLWNLLGICESELNEPAEARAAFEKGLKLDPASVSLNENLGFLFYRQSEYAAAKRYLTTAIAHGSSNPGVAFSLAASQIRTGQEEQGLKLLRELETPLANQSEYWSERGWAELHLDPKNAASSFDRALALAPNDVRALNGAASAAEADKEDEKAIHFLLTARKASPDDVRTLLHFGSVCLRRDLSVDAQEAIERAYKLQPSNNLALFLDARVKIAFQQWQESHQLFAEFDKRVPGYAPTQYAMGWLDTKMNKPEEARQHLEKSLSLDPANADVLYELGQLDLNEGHVEAAETRFQSALNFQPGHSKAQIGMGDIAVRKNDIEAAKKHFEAAIAADPNSGPAHYKLSTVLLRLHDNEGAQKERTVGATLNAEALKASKTVLLLADPDGRLLSGVKTKGNVQ